MNEPTATRYQRLRRRAHGAGLAAGALMLLVVTLTPASRGLAIWAYGAGRGLAEPYRMAIALVTFVAIAVVLWEMVALPAVLYLGLRIDRRFRRAEYTVEDVIGAQARATLVALFAAVFAAAIVVLAMQISHSAWWLTAGVLLAVGLAAALQAAPIVMSLVGSVERVARPSLDRRLATLAAGTGISVAAIGEWRVPDSSDATALVFGVGARRRIVVSSQLLRDWSDEEIAVVVAHELAHLTYHDLWRSLALDAAVLSFGMWTADAVLQGVAQSPGAGGPDRLATLPLIALVAGGVWLLATPLRHAQSRLQERRADEFALQLTGAADAFGAAIRRLGARHLAEDRPARLTHWLFHHHPTVSERLAIAENYRRCRAGRT